MPAQSLHLFNQFVVKSKVRGYGATFTDKAKDAVDMTMAFSTFADGTIYSAKFNPDIKKQELGVVIENTGYKKLEH